MPAFGWPILRSAVLIGAVGFLIFIVNSGTWVDQQLTSRTDQTALEESLAVYINEQLADKNIPGISISVVRNQETVFEQGFGLANPVQQIEASPYTVYHGGTLAQLFTTIAVLQRVELGYLDLDIPVSNYLPEFTPQNPYGLPLTLRQILSHQSGLPTEPPLGHSYDSTPATLAETVYSLNNSSVVYPPETFTKFSNAGFGVAGLILESSTERPFAQYMRAILDRMDLMRTSYSPRLDLKGKLATGHAISLEQFLTPTTFYETGNIAALNLYTTANDLGTFLKVIFADGQSANGTILSPASLEQMWTVQLSTIRKQVPYGLGLAVSDIRGMHRASMSSNHNGYSAYIDLVPEQKIGVVILANVGHAEATLKQISSYALEFLLRENEGLLPPEIPRTNPVNPAMFAQAVGYYEAPQPLHISALDDELYLYQDGRRYRLRQIGDSLIVDDAQKYGTILLSDGLSIQVDNTLYVKRDPLSSIRANRAYDEYLGVYGSKENPIALIEHHDQLLALKGWVSTYQLDPASPDTFSLPADGMYGGEEVIVIRDELNNIAQLQFANMTLDWLPPHAYQASIEQIPLIQPFNPLVSSATPPYEDSTLFPAQLVDLTMRDPLLNTEVDFATQNNIYGANLYNEARILLQQPIADAIFNIKDRIRPNNLGLVIHDAYRPWRITNAIWNSIPDSVSAYFNSPNEGSCQNRGAGISVSLYTLNTGEKLVMPTPYGVLSPAAYADYPLLPAVVQQNREFLRRLMESEGFRASKYRWWHFVHGSCESYPIMDIMHENVDQSNIMMDTDPIRVVR